MVRSRLQSSALRSSVSEAALLSSLRVLQPRSAQHRRGAGVPYAPRSSAHNSYNRTLPPACLVGNIMSSIVSCRVVSCRVVSCRVVSCTVPPVLADAHHAAECGCVKALLGLARLHSGLPAACLPGLAIPEEERDESLRRHYYEFAAQGGELEAALWVAQQCEQEGDAEAADRYFADADQMMATGKGVAEIGQMPHYEVRAKRAALAEAAGERGKAADLYSEASEIAMAAFKTKVGMRYMMRSEELSEG